MARVLKTTYLTGPKDKRVRRKSRKWYIEYRDENGIPRRVAGFTDKAATIQKAAELEREAERRASGLIDRFAEHRKRPLSEHLGDWHKGLIDKGTTSKHADLVKMRADRVFGGCRCTRWQDISASAVQGYVAKLRDDGLSAQTRNFYVQAAKQFCRWMVSDRRAESNPLEHLRSENVKVDRRHDRAEFSVEALQRLVVAAHNGPTIRGVPGPERALTYRLVAETGLRADEVRSVTVGSFSLDGSEPAVKIAAENTKNRREALQPFRPALADDLRQHFRGKLPTAPAFKMPGKYDVARVLRQDLEAARKKWIEEAPNPNEKKKREESCFLAYRDGAGRVHDFHALRHTFGTLLKQAGVHPKDAQLLMRHSTITLTMDRYTHGVVGDLSAALTALPDFSPDSGQQTRQRATGTHGGDSCEAVATTEATPQAQNNVGSSRAPDATDEPRPMHSVLHCVSAGISGSGRKGAKTPIVASHGTGGVKGATPATTQEPLSNKGEVAATGAGRHRVARHDIGKKETRPAGLEPAAYGLGNRCSILTELRARHSPHHTPSGISSLHV